MKLKKGLVVLAALLSVSCASVTPENRCASKTASKPDNLIQDADFSLEAADKRSKFWLSAQHSGATSFETGIHEGVLTITKIGPQPWFVMRQSLPSRELAGQKVVFQAELKLELEPPKIAHGFGDGGWLRIVARSEGGKLLARSEIDHEPHIGTTDWQAVTVEMVLPAKTHRIDLNFLHQADGIMQIRNPFFGVVTPLTDGCSETGMGQ